jgi:hypothetical protein
MGRRRVTLIAVVGIAVLALAGCEWTALGYDLGNTRSSGDNVINVTNVPALNRAFTGITGSTVRSSPAVAKDIAYVAAGDAKLYAFDALGMTNCDGTPKTCDPLWTAALGNSSPGNPTVADGRVFVQTAATLFAFNAAGCSAAVCTPLWRHNFASSSGYTSDAIVAEGTVYVTHQTGLYAFDAAGPSARCTTASGVKTCTPKWTASGVNTAQNLAPPAFANGRVYAGGVRGSNKVSVFNVATCSANGGCTPEWTTSAGGGGVTVAGGSLYSGGAGYLYAFDANGITNCPVSPSGKVCGPRWRYELYTGIDTLPAIANGIVYSGAHGSGVTVPLLLGAFPADGSGCPIPTMGPPTRTCSALWTSSVPGAGGEKSAPAVANGIVFVGSKNKNVYAFNANGCSAPTCDPVWSRATNGEIESSPAVSNGRLVVGTLGNSLYVFK